MFLFATNLRWQATVCSFFLFRLCSFHTCHAESESPPRRHFPLVTRPPFLWTRIRPGGPNSSSTAREERSLLICVQIVPQSVDQPNSLNCKARLMLTEKTQTCICFEQFFPELSRCSVSLSLLSCPSRLESQSGGCSSPHHSSISLRVRFASILSVAFQPI